MTDFMAPPLTAVEAARAEVLRSWHNVARAIAEWRATLGLTQQQLAHRAGTKQSRISELEGARGNVRFDTLNRVTLALGLEVALQERQPLHTWTSWDLHAAPECCEFQQVMQLTYAVASESKALPWTESDIEASWRVLLSQPAPHPPPLTYFREDELYPYRLASHLTIDAIEDTMDALASRASSQPPRQAPAARS